MCKPLRGPARKGRATMASRLEIRAQIDTEVARGLALVNSGGAVALLALIPQLLDRPEYHVLAKATFNSFGLLQIGLVLAVLHNRFRRICDLLYDQVEAYSPSQHPEPCTILGLACRECSLPLPMGRVLAVGLACFVYPGRSEHLVVRSTGSWGLRSTKARSAPTLLNAGRSARWRPCSRRAHGPG